MMLGNTKQRILQYIESKGIGKPQFYNDLGIKRGLLDSDKMNSTVTDVVIAKILVAYTDINPIWLLTGEGSMLRDSQTSEENRPSTTPISQTEESIIYKMYKEKEAKIEELLKENGRLEERIRQLESQNKEFESHPIADNVTEAFTSESSGDYGEDSIPTKLPSTSKRLSAGKI